MRLQHTGVTHLKINLPHLIPVVALELIGALPKSGYFAHPATIY
jgi:hypothetical protein